MTSPAVLREDGAAGKAGGAVAVVIPTLDEEQSIADVVRSLPRAIVSRVMVADGGSRDATVARAQAAGAEVIDAGPGYGRACLAAAMAAEDADIVVFMDGDGADDADSIGRLVEPIRSGCYDFVIASRVLGNREPGSIAWHQLAAGRLAGWGMRLLYGVRYTDMCALRAIRRDALMQLGMRELTYGWNLEMQMRAARAPASSRPLPACPAKLWAGAIIAFELEVRRTIALALLALLVCASPAPAQTAADLQLVLAVDASGSVDRVRFDLQKSGYVAAFRHARVLQAIRSGPNRAIAVTMLQWTGPAQQVQTVGWSLVGEEETASAFAAAIERAPRQLFGGGTSISGAIDYAATLFPISPFAAPRRVIDVSGDGSNNRGRPVALARDAAVAAGIGINGLPILALEPDLDRYYYDNVIGGAGAFVVPAQNYETFADAILKKLIAEIAANDR